MHISEFTEGQLHAALAHRARQLMADAGITVDDLEAKNIVSYTQVRNAKIRAEYQEKVASGVKAEAVVQELMVKYRLGYDMMKSIVTGRR